MFLDIHALHTLPYSNVNRDGLGSPKSCLYGGAPRIRVSSQSWKRAARLAVEQQLGSATVRTRQIADTVRRDLIEHHGWPDDDARRAGRAIVHAYGMTPDDKTDATNVLLWLPTTVVSDLTQLALDHRHDITGIPLPELDDKGESKRLSKKQKDEQQQQIDTAVAPLTSAVTDILNRRHPLIALLGRMLADTPEHTVDGATQVAHAFTIHESAADFDYFTAVDDLQPRGAGHLATAEFAAGTFYRYCTVNITQLVDQLGDVDTALRLIEAWARALLTTIPSGKKNSTAPATVPDLVHLAIRSAPLSLAAAFEKPIPTSPAGYAQPGRVHLDDYAGRLHRFLNDPGRWRGYATPSDDHPAALGERYDSLDELVQAATNTLLDQIQPEAAA